VETARAVLGMVETTAWRAARAAPDTPPRVRG
jgi:hypothetical protein